MNRIQHLFFDLDNTLWDHRKNAELTLRDLFDKEQVATQYGLGFEEFHREYFTINEHLWALIRDGQIGKEELRHRRFYESFLFFGIDDLPLAQRFEHHFLDEIVRYNELVPGTGDLLGYLKTKGYRLHILSNGFQEVTRRKCELSGIAGYFETITSADEIGIRKPHPEIFLHAMAKSGAAAADSAMIGDDWIADIEGSSALGLKSYFLDVFRDNPSAEGVTVVQSLAALKDFF